MNHLCIAFLFFMAFGIAGALVYRWRGSDYGIRPLSQIAFSYPYFLVVFLHYSRMNWGRWDGLGDIIGNDKADIFWDWLPLIGSGGVAVIVGLVTFAAVCTGHGGWQDLGTWLSKRSDERMEFLIKWAHGKIPEYWYDALGLAMNGLCMSLPAGIALMNPWLALSGALKAVAYMQALKLRGVHGKFTELAEYLTGYYLWGCLSVAIFEILL